jgi:hypothetical protein
MATFTQTELDITDVGLIELRPFSKSSPAPSLSHSHVTVSDDVRGEAVPPLNAFEARPRWNHPSNKWKVFAAFWSFLVVGLNDGSYGVCFSTSSLEAFLTSINSLGGNRLC